MSKDKKDLSEIENKLKNYFLKDQKIKSYKLKIEVIKKQKAELDLQIKNNDIVIPIESSSPSFEERVQTTPTGMSYAERTMLNIIDKKIMESSNYQEDIYALESKIRRIEIDCAEIGENIKTLDEDSLKLLSMRYKDNKKDWQIGQDLRMDQSTVTRKRMRILLDIFKFENWVN
jgi:hypothetical protein